MPFTNGTLALPDWLPWWVPAVLLVPLALYGLLALLVPFSTFGVKTRLAAIELRLEEVHEELRALTPHLPQRMADPPRYDAMPGEADDRVRFGRGLRAEPRLGPR